MKTLIQKFPRWVIVTVALLIFGLIRVPIESKLREGLTAAYLLQPPPPADNLLEMSQSVLMGTLGGLRSLVAVYYSLEAYTHFSYTEWDELSKSYQQLTSLEPREESHWNQWVWHIGINAVANVEGDPKLGEIERKIKYDEYTQKALAVGRKGLEKLPESFPIRLQMAEVYRVKLKDPCATAQMYKEMIGLPQSLTYVTRFYGYFLADCPGNEQEAYDHLIGLYNEGEQHHLPTLIVKIKELETKLKIPIYKWIPNPDPDVLMMRQRKSGDPLPGAIRLP